MRFILAAYLLHPFVIMGVAMHNGHDPYIMMYFETLYHSTMAIMGAM